MKIDDPDEKERHAADGGRGAEERIQLERQPRPDKEQKKDRRAEVVQLLEQLVVLGEVDVDRAHRHAAQQRGDVEERTDAAEREQQGNGDDQPIVGGVFFEQHPLHREAEEAAEGQDPCVDGNGKKDVSKVELKIEKIGRAHV